MLLSGYSSSSENESNGRGTTQRVAFSTVEIAPSVSETELHDRKIAIVSTHDGSALVQKQAYDNLAFEQQLKTHKSLSYSHALNGKIVTSDLDVADKVRNQETNQLRATKKEMRALKKRRTNKGTPGILDGESAYVGPWAKYNDSSSEEEENIKDISSSPDTEEERSINENEPYEDQEDSTEFYGNQISDYLGRSYMHPPNEASRRSPPQECFVPKKLIHKWTGHHNGTNKIVLFPNTAHLLLSCGNDSKIFLWAVYSKRELLRGFFGHSKPIRDICFNNDGKFFLSSSYDKTVKLWNTETGECLMKFQLQSVANVIKFNPFDNDEFLVGLVNHKIEHYRISSKELLQVYDHHLGSINSLTFLPNKRFISSSEDKTVRVWDIHINIPIKLISDPTLHSMPVVKVHPEEKYFAAQSMDNSIMVFSARDRYKTNKKKIFTGHNCAGYGIGIDFSPDGRNLVSGDSMGYALFWDWKTTKLVKKLKIDNKAVTQVIWNMNEVSKVIMSGSSGTIYYYE